MDFPDVFKIPQRPRLKFGETLDNVCKDNNFHVGLKDLFLKAYLAARGDDSDDYSVLFALRPGTNGQGTLSERILLKSKLESGEWLVPLQTPTGAPLWLLRHFLGRLPEPLLKGLHWKILGEACGASNASVPQLFEKIAGLTKSLSQIEFEVLALLTLLIRKLSLKKHPELNIEELQENVLYDLSKYFIASIITRPFRPGLYTTVDKQYQPLVIFLARYWDRIFKGSNVISSENESNSEFDGEVKQAYKYFQDDLSQSNQIPRNKYRFIGFESILLAQNSELSKERFADNINGECSYKSNSTGNSDRINMNSSMLSQIKRVNKSSKEKLFIEENKTFVEDVQKIDSRFLIDFFGDSNVRLKACPRNSKEVTVVGTNPKMSKSLTKIYENERNNDKLQEYNTSDYHFTRKENKKTITKTSSTENEFFSFPSSQESN